ncbi:MAG: Spy/CpxP family protein refolding chaperone [Alphaproteobacteria bacterium]|nr:Spy/CpxP family protein refolding chaperone [Alphaproteobacteria bacterium]
MIAGGVAASVLGLSIIAASANPASPPAGGLEAAAPAFAGAVHKAHFRGKGGKARKAGFCGKYRGARMERMFGIVEGLMEFNAEQQSAWDNLKTAATDGQEKVEKSCEALKAEDKPRTAPARLDRMQQMLSARLSALQTVRPAFEKFYGTLSEKQQKAIDDLFSRRHGRHKAKRRQG